MKIKRSITGKLFIVTIAVFIVFITITFLVQYVFFEKFYINTKKKTLKSEIISLNSQYNSLTDEEAIKNVIETLEQKNNYKIVMQNNKGDLKYLTNLSYKKPDFKLKMVEKIIFDKFYNKDILNKLKESKETNVFVMNEKDDEMKSIIGVVYNEKKDEYIYMFSSLQPVNEASGAIKEFYKYFYIAAIFMIAILSFVYSSIVTKPLKRITKTALKMSNLDFKEKCSVKSNDEIGELSKSLNFLSENLNTTLTSLKKANLKLEKDIEKERKLMEMQKNFVAAVSHELKTPITLIEGYSEALKDDVADEKERNYFVDVILDESNKMENLVKDMLDLSQLETGNFNLVKEEFYLEELIESVTNKFSSIINKKEIHLKLNLLKDVKVNADWQRIEQVINNYMTNAIRHTYDNGTITVTMKEKDDFVVTEVENTGDKLSKEQREKVWDYFYKVDKSRNRKLGGTGIGLSIVKNIVQLHNGKVGVENTENGVKFKFSIKRTI